MQVGSGFKKAKLDNHYDAIVVGSGIGGLTAAALLAKDGKKVLVLEKHYTAGGYTHTFTRKGFEWDVGVHYVGEVHRERSILRKICNDISENRMEWAKMEDVYDRAIIGQEHYDFVAGVEAFKNQMTAYFPHEKKAIEHYINLVFEVNSTSAAFFGERAMPPLLGRVASPFMRSRFLKFSNQTVTEVLNKLTNDQKLIGVLCTQWGDYGLTPNEASFAIHAMLVRHYFDGGNYPVGGSSSIANAIAPTIENAGGKILIRAGVQKILLEGNQAIGVKMETGEEIRSDVVISNVGVINTFTRLVSPEFPAIQKIVQKLRGNVRPSYAHLGVYIGLDYTAEELGLRQTNLWVFPSYDHDANIKKYLQDPENEFPVIYISFPSAKDPQWYDHYPGKSTIEIVSFAPFEWFGDWEGTQWYKRGDAYLTYKEKLTQRLLNALYQHVPSVHGKISHYELSTPLSTQHFTSYQKGELYGLDHTPLRFRQRWLRAHTPIKNLFLTGQDILTVGVTGALMGGVITASAVTNRNIVNEILQRAKH